MRAHKNFLKKRVAAALTATAVLIGGVPAAAQPTPANNAADPTWTVKDESGKTTEVEPAVPSVEIPNFPAEDEDKDVPVDPPAPPTLTQKNTKENKVVSSPELAEDVTFKHVRSLPDGAEEYRLEAKLNLPALDGSDQALPLDDISFVSTKGPLNIESVEDTKVDGTKVDEDSVDVVNYPENPTEEEKNLIPDEMTGDVITVDTTSTVLSAETDVTTTVYTTEKATSDVEWKLYRGAVPEVAEGAALLANDPYGPLDPTKARLVVQVAGDWLGPNGKNNAPESTSCTRDWLGRPQNCRQDTLFKYSAGEGAVLRLYAPSGKLDENATNTRYSHKRELTPINEPWAVCTADASGSCVFDVPADGNGYYWVGMEKASDGYSVIDRVRTGGSGAIEEKGIEIAYVFATPQLKQGERYFSGNWYKSPRRGNYDDNVFMTTPGTNSREGKITRHRNSTGSIFQVRDNPELKKRCGTKVGFLVDTSGSMGRQGIESTKNFLRATVAGLTGSGAQVGMATFATDSPGADNPRNILRPVSMNGDRVPQELNNYINRITQVERLLDPRGDTDWEEGLRQFYNEGYDVVYMITDGNPTRTETRFPTWVWNWPDGDGVHTYANTVEAAVGVANALKAQGTRVVPIGVPSKWTYYPASVDVTMAVFLGPIWWILRSQTRFGETRVDASAQQELELSASNLAALSGPKQFGVNGVNSMKDADFVLNPDPGPVIKGILESIGKCSITVERRLYEGSDPVANPPVTDNSRALTEAEAANWPMFFRGTPQGGGSPDAVDRMVLPRVENNPGYPGADRSNYYAEYVLNGTHGYQVDVREQKTKAPLSVEGRRITRNPDGSRKLEANGTFYVGEGAGRRKVDFAPLTLDPPTEVNGVPEGWIAVKAATRLNAEGQCVGPNDPSGKETAIDQRANITDLPSAANPKPATDDFRASNIPLEGGCHYIVYYMTAPTTFKFKLNKVDAHDNSVALDGAQFKLEGLDKGNTDPKDPVSVDGAGKGEFNWDKLKPGRYKLTETKAADGGYLLVNPVYFRVASVTEPDGDKVKRVTKLYILADENDQKGTEVTPDNADQIVGFPIVEFRQTEKDGSVQITMKLANTKTGELPKTGGNGVFIQILLGVLLLLAGAFTARRRIMA
ncbi:hypothetical protein CJ203_02985 [Corynebacterium tuscaniense]|uniref:VWFA domain-containing protein n=1 Tax=Corynebacterium tuscaniense TaxID=302449 RepID=A0A2N6T6P1_9CORY|nr:VWA domain-containing protein [Corynebacterium tuscaniense]PMC64994.1 hypothetical protein CJ203_02985 [Corynebacterium tuscaniense]